PPAGDSEETQEVFLALARFARLVAAEREGSEKARLLARTVFEQVPVGLRLGGEISPEQVLEVNVRAVPHGAAAGEPAAVGVVRDVTERERTETMRRRFVSDVSHELRTPIAAIRAAVETLAGESDLPPDLARLMSILERQSSEMEALVSDLTDLSQIESGAVKLAIERIPLLPLLLSVVRDLAPASEARGVTVTVEAG